jgi:uncharacterized protein (TIGR03067 family)
MNARGLLKLMAFVGGSIATIGSTRLECAPAPAPEEYVFVRDTDRWVGMVKKEIRKGKISTAEIRLVGKLDANGDFTQVYRFETPPSMSPNYTLINLPGPKPKKVYEFRSGRLIKGELTTEGNFVPETSSTIIKFESYEFSPDAIPIWNLPGTFMKKDEAALQGKWSGEISEGTTVELVIKKPRLTWIRTSTSEGVAKKESVDFDIMKVDQVQRPKEIDLRAAEGEFREKIYLGIYKLDGDKLTIRRSQPGEARPKDFEAAEGDKNPALTLRKAP